MSKTTNLNKINHSQKSMLADYMLEHPYLARNILPNCAQGRATAIRLWNELASKLNSVGPPVKDAKLWRKVYADQKYQAKKKLFYNKDAKRRTGGGPYKEKLLTHDEEQIIEASGLEIPANENEDTLDQFDSKEGILTSQLEDMEDESLYLSDDSFDLPSSSKKKKKKKNANPDGEFQMDVCTKLDRLLDIEERVLQMKEEKHETFLAVKRFDLKMKKLKYEILKSLHAATLETKKEKL